MSCPFPNCPMCYGPEQGDDDVTYKPLSDDEILKHKDNGVWQLENAGRILETLLRANRLAEAAEGHDCNMGCKICVALAAYRGSDEKRGET